MGYKFRDDIVLECVCGAYIIVALRPAWKEYPFAIKISSRSAYIWRGLESGKSESEIVKGLTDRYPVTSEWAEKLYQNFISYCVKHHYFISEK